MRYLQFSTIGGVLLGTAAAWFSLQGCQKTPPAAAPEGPVTAPKPKADAGPTAKDDRTRLPMADPRYPAETHIDPKDAQMHPPIKIRPPEGAPNVVVILLDDLGFGGPSTFGGPINMPTLDRVAKNGLRYNRFHTVALCAPTRVALKQGRNHHMADMGAIPEIATGFAGNTSRVPNDTAPVAEVLRLNGYNTAAFGKWHATLGRETTASGSQDRWPTRQGFEKFYGFIGAEENNYQPSLYDGVTKIDVPASPDYHLSEDMTREAIEWMREQHSMTPEKPFFIYFAPAGVHAPHQVAQKWSDKYKGKFDSGYDVHRQATLKRQIDSGIVPEGTELAKTADSIRPWESLTDEERRMFARQAEVFAGYAEHTDYEVGRLLDAVDGLGETENTLVIYISGDNGTSPEGNQTGNWNWGNMLNGREETMDEQLAYYDNWGGPETYAHMTVGWSIAFDAPFAYTKQVAGDFGGTRNGTAISWPKGMKARGELREQFSHVIDIAPTILEAAGLPAPEFVHGVKQVPLQGTSLLYTFDEPKAPERHTVQYFEVVGNRGIYVDGWLARNTVKFPWELKKMHDVTSDEGWQLFNTREDFSLAKDLAAKEPERLVAMKKQFLEEAEKNNVLPLDDRLLERLLPEAAGRPTLMGDRKTITLYPGTVGINENALLNLKNTSSSVKAELAVGEGKVNQGVLMAQGGRFGGWALFVEDGVPGYVYNDLGKLVILKAKKPLDAGKHQVEARFTYDGKGMGKGGELKLFVDDTEVSSERLDRSIGFRFSIDEAADVGRDRGTAVLQRNLGEMAQSAYDGDLHHVTITLL
ncbi:MAG: arylsulfatase [Polyangiaceae bacterium]|nr:arylsulfatase [Polyangiaceae bacterium]